MAEVVIRFDDRFREMMLNCTKLTTCRPEKKGEPGDTFEAFGKTFIITRVLERPLEECIVDYEIDGFGSPTGFFKFWLDTYGKWEPGRVVYQHWFLPYED